MKITFLKYVIALLVLSFNNFLLTSYAQSKLNFQDLVHSYKTGHFDLPANNYWIYSGLEILLNTNTDTYTSIEKRVIYNLIDIKIHANSLDDPPYKEVFYLIDKGLTDTDGSNVYFIYSILKNIPTQYFNSTSKQRLSNIIITNKSLHIKEAIKLSGKLSIQVLLPYYESVLISPNKYSRDIIWTVRLAMARMDDINQTNYCIESVKSIGINDNVVFYLIPDLIYTRSRSAFNYILELITESPENCHSTDPDNPQPISCAFRLMEMIAPYIKDFPVELYESGDIKTDDYNKALTKVQRWISENKETYQLTSPN
nr:hypothetical protein [uncultured Carboxylicivirga sp.]